MAEATDPSGTADSGRSETLPTGHETVTPFPESDLEMGHPTVESDLAEKDEGGGFKAEIDTSAPFESVKAAATRFGGFGFWRPNHAKLPDFEKLQQDLGEVDASAVEEQAAELEKFLIEKERETLEVLKELETTRVAIEDLKQKLPKEMPEVDPSTANDSDDQCKNLSVKESDEGIPHEKVGEGHQSLSGGMGGGSSPSLAPGLILSELKQAKLNLTRTTHDLAEIRASVDSYNKKIEKERISLEKTRKRLNSNVSKISCLEEQLNHTRLKVNAAKGAESNDVSSESPMDISRELQRLNSEAEQFKKMGVAAKSEVLRAMSEIEQMGARIRTAEIRLIAAKKMKEAARSAEAVALADIRVMSNGGGTFLAASQNPKGVVTLSSEEYSSLTCNAREAEERSKKRVVDAMHLVEEVNVSKVEILKRVEEATEEIKTSRKALEEALSRVEAANREKLRVEAALRRWRSENGQRKRSAIQNSTKFKNPHPSHRRRDSHMLDADGLNLSSDEPAVPALRSTLSIGQILSRKLLLADGLGNGVQTKRGGMKRKVSLGQMLSKHSSELFHSSEKVGQVGSSGRKQFPANRKKKFGFSKFSVLLTKQNKKKKPAPPNSQ